MLSKASNILFNVIKKYIWVLLDLQGQIEYAYSLTKLSLNFPSSIKFPLLMPTPHGDHTPSCLSGWIYMFSFLHPTEASSGEGAAWFPMGRPRALHTAAQTSAWEHGPRARSRPIYLLCLSFLLCKTRIIKIHKPKVEVRINCVNSSKIFRIIPGM